jgi:chromosome partitioning protein
MSARILAIANKKGGTGKTTTVVNLAAALAQRGYRVLVVDLDPQGHSGLGFGVLAKQDDVTVHSLLARSGLSFSAGVQPTDEPGVDLIPADRNFDSSTKIGNPRCMADGLASLRQAYDVILIDTPPASSSLIVCALLASDGVIVPTALEPLSLDGVRQFAKAYHRVVVSLQAALLGLAILPMRVDLRSGVQKLVLEHLARSFGKDQIVSGVRTDTKVSEAFGMRKPLLRHESRARAVSDFEVVASEVIRRFSCQLGRTADQVST